MALRGFLNSKLLKYLQPMGFALLLTYFVFAKMPWAIVAFWMGVLLTTLGTIFEIVIYFGTNNKQRTQAAWVFYLGIFIKLLLIVAIALRVYDVKYSVFILLGCIVISFVWFALSQFIKPAQNHNPDILDTE